MAVSEDLAVQVAWVVLAVSEDRAAQVAWVA